MLGRHRSRWVGPRCALRAQPQSDAPPPGQAFRLAPRLTPLSSHELRAGSRRRDPRGAPAPDGRLRWLGLAVAGGQHAPAQAQGPQDAPQALLPQGGGCGKGRRRAGAQIPPRARQPPPRDAGGAAPGPLPPPGEVAQTPPSSWGGLTAPPHTHPPATHPSRPTSSAKSAPTPPWSAQPSTKMAGCAVSGMPSHVTRASLSSACRHGRARAPRPPTPPTHHPSCLPPPPRAPSQAATAAGSWA